MKEKLGVGNVVSLSLYPSALWSEEGVGTVTQSEQVSGHQEVTAKEGTHLPILSLSPYVYPTCFAFTGKQCDLYQMQLLGLPQA